MKRRQDGWVSEYRRQKFLESRKKPFRDFSVNYLGDMDKIKIPSRIAVMLDLDGTIDGIDDEKASAFIRQLDYLREKFQADEGIISISTHHDNACKIKSVLDIMARNLSSTIKIGMSFYYGGTYDYEKQLDLSCGMGFNRDKVETFDCYYVRDTIPTNKWFAIIDDGIDDSIYLKYQNSHPMLVCKPSQNERSVTKNNFMRRATITKGFDGVLELLEEYIEEIKGLSISQILGMQFDMITHLSCFELVEKIRKRDYRFLERYFKEGYADDDDYDDTLGWLLLTNSKGTPSKEELIYLSRIFSFMIGHFEEKKEDKNVQKVLQYQKDLEKLVEGGKD